MKREPVGAWLFLAGLVALFANALAIFTTARTFGVMGSVSEFAMQVRDADRSLIVYYNLVAFPGTTGLAVWYVWPIVVYLRRGAIVPSLVVQRRVISAPLVVAGLGLAAWLIGCAFFPLATIVRFGHWSPDLMSQHVLSPLVSAFLAATTTYLLLDWLVQARLVPRVFPEGRLAAVPGVLALGVRARLLVFLVAVAFTPLFTMLGLVRAAVVRINAGVPLGAVVPVLAHASGTTFVVYVALGVGLTLLVARGLTRPLAEMAAALRRVQAGELRSGVRVTSNDELGILEDGVNALVTSLREKEHILKTFGRVVEPPVRDQLLRGTLQLGGEVRTASVLFCDMRGFTGIAERTPPTQVVSTLNEFFTAMTTWVRQSGGFVDKFIGDALLVVFGLFGPDGSGRHAEAATAALRCALGMRERLAELNAARAAAGEAALGMTVGVHTGELVAGIIGAHDRHEYTVIGDTVNVAARLQELCKQQGHDLLISETTYELARASGYAPRIAAESSVTLRGRSEPVRIFGIA